MITPRLSTLGYIHGRMLDWLWGAFLLRNPEDQAPIPEHHQIEKKRKDKGRREGEEEKKKRKKHFRTSLFPETRVS